MATLTIRNLDDMVKQRLRERAARHGRSMEEEARLLLGDGVAAKETPPVRETLYDRIMRLRNEFGPVDLEIPPRTSMAGERPVFDWIEDE